MFTPAFLVERRYHRGALVVLAAALTGATIGGCNRPSSPADSHAHAEPTDQAVNAADQDEPDPAPKTDAKPDPKARDAEAREMLAAVQSLTTANDFTGAQAKLAEMKAQFGDTPTYRKRGARMAAEIGVIGKDAPTFAVDKWFREDKVDFASKKPTVLVFFEQWCPHCKREVPKLDELYAKHKDAGMQLVGLTKMTRNSTDEQVEALIKDVAYPVGKEDGSLSRAFAVSGIPAAAVVKDGKIVWRGHPSRIDDAMIAGWLASS